MVNEWIKKYTVAQNSWRMTRAIVLLKVLRVSSFSASVFVIGPSCGDFTNSAHTFYNYSSQFNTTLFTQYQYKNNPAFFGPTYSTQTSSAQAIGRNVKPG